MRYSDDMHQPITEGKINGKMTEYHACGTGDLKEVKEFYTNFYYIGSGDGIYLDGQHCQSGIEYHFFIRKNDQP